MAKNNPPDGWEMDNGVWGTDADENSSVVLSGSHSIEFFSSATSPRFKQTPEKATPVQGDRPYRFEITVRSTSAASNANWALRVFWLDENKAAVSDSQLFSKDVAVADTWETFGATAVAPAGARYVICRIDKTSAISWTGYLDDVSVFPAVPRWHVTNASAQTLTSSAWNKVQWGTATTEIGVTFDNANDEIDIKESGIYTIHALISVINLDDDELIVTSLAINGTRTHNGESRYIRNAGSVGSREESSPVSITRYFNEGDVLSLEVFVGAAATSSVATSEGAATLYWMGARVE